MTVPTFRGHVRGLVRTHPLARDIALAVWCDGGLGTLKDHSGYGACKEGVKAGTSPMFTSENRAIRNTGTSGGYIDMGTKDVFGYATAMTVIAGIRSTGTGSTWARIVEKNNTTMFVVRDTGRYLASLIWTDVGSYDDGDNSSAPTITTGVYAAVGLQWRASDGRISYFKDGVMGSYHPTRSGAYLASGTGIISLMNRQTSQNRYLIGDLFWLFIFRRELSVAEVKAISDNPYVFADRGGIPLVNAPTGGAQQIDAALTMSESAGLTQTANAAYGAGLVMTAAQSETAGDVAELRAAAAYAQSLGMTPTAAAALAPTILFACSLAKTDTASATVLAALTIAAARALALDGSMNAAVIDAALTLAAAMGQAQSSSATLAAAHLLGVIAGISPTATATLTAGTTMTITEALALTANAAQSAGVSLSAIFSQVATLANIIQAETALTAQRGMTPASAATISATETLASACGMAAAAGASLGASAAYATAVAMASVAGALLHAGISLSRIISITQDETSFLITVLTPDNRTLRVRYEDRVVVVERRRS